MEIDQVSRAILPNFVQEKQMAITMGHVGKIRRRYYWHGEY
ncbi:MAG: hypothetical protein ACREXR_20215 [Gammaproteobacteria bacterium]